MKFVQDWNKVEGFDGAYDVEKRVIGIFSKWEKKNLIIVAGRRERTVDDTYGFAYTSSSSFALLGVCNVQAILKGTKDVGLDWLAVNTDMKVVAGFTDYKENVQLIILGDL